MSQDLSWEEGEFRGDTLTDIHSGLQVSKDVNIEKVFVCATTQKFIVHLPTA